MVPVSYDCTNNFGKMPLLVALLMHSLAMGEMARHVIHGIVGCLATSVAKVPERWKHSIKLHRSYNRYKTIFELWSIFLFQVIRLVTLLIGWPTYIDISGCHALWMSPYWGYTRGLTSIYWWALISLDAHAPCRSPYWGYTRGLTSTYWCALISLDTHAPCRSPYWGYTRGLTSTYWWALISLDAHAPCRSPYWGYTRGLTSTYWWALISLDAHAPCRSPYWGYTRGCPITQFADQLKKNIIITIHIKGYM